MSNIRQIIEERLRTLEPEFFDFEDESHLHAGHAGNKGGGHYAIVVVSNAFENIGRLQRQRMIKQLLQDLFSDGLNVFCIVSQPTSLNFLQKIQHVHFL